MKLLVIGGTQFLGRHIVDRAQASGHDVTLFNRGNSNPELFPDVRKIKGDRYQDLHLAANENWDVVIDTSGYYPENLKTCADLFSEKCKKYIFVSSVSVYSDFSKLGITESSPTLEPATDEELTDKSMKTYGVRKMACDKVVLDSFGSKAIVIRPGLIVGPHDPTWRFPYWIDRVEKGGRVLVPEPKNSPVQFIDARDLANWIVELCSSNETGIFNSVGPDDKTTFEDYLEACRRNLNPDTEFVWVSREFIEEKEVSLWVNLPVNISLDSPGFLQVDNTKAYQAGLRSGGIDKLVLDTAKWIKSEGLSRVEPFGLSAERESKLLTEWESWKASE